MGKRQDWTIIEKLGSTILTHVQGCIFEIGIGKSSPILKKFADDFKRDFYCLDMSHDKCEWARSVGCKVIEGKTKSTLKQFPKIPVAMGLIDGRHTAEAVRQEVHFFLERLTLGGVIFMHDTYMPTDAKIRDDSHPRGASGDPYKVRQELEKQNDVQVFTWPYTAMDQGITMIMKRDLCQPCFKDYMPWLNEQGD